ncbi:hypothetical protein BDZ85DRAFT_259833 [Elsinoe ampelina]|uniref:Uncharacterized protein n=1 Tax=Elsinoe ampelina TaxID=302913 RepID=A0A6A6GHW0_9PEZI|nr:hypothetical protein BDZ85DRAFT_259833 [Elsinoe ampelina]
MLTEVVARLKTSINSLLFASSCCCNSPSQASHHVTKSQALHGRHAQWPKDSHRTRGTRPPLTYEVHKIDISKNEQKEPWSRTKLIRQQSWRSLSLPPPAPWKGDKLSTTGDGSTINS